MTRENHDAFHNFICVQLKKKMWLSKTRISKGIKNMCECFTLMSYQNTNLRTALVAVVIAASSPCSDPAIPSSAGNSNRGGFPISDIRLCMRIYLCMYARSDNLGYRSDSNHDTLCRHTSVVRKIRELSLMSSLGGHLETEGR